MKKSILLSISDYVRIRKIGVNDEAAWKISEMESAGDRLVGYTCAIVMIVAGVFFFIDYQEAKAAEYTKSLENTLAACVSDTYKPIKIGDEWFLCGINKI